MAGPNVGGATLQQKEPFSIKRFFSKKSNIFLLIEGIFFAWFIFAFLIYPNLNLFADVLFSGVGAGHAGHQKLLHPGHFYVCYR